MKTFKSIVSAAAILFSAAVVMSNSTGCSTEETVRDDELVLAAEQALKCPGINSHRSQPEGLSRDLEQRRERHGV